jgi:hypothetical protein
MIKLISLNACFSILILFSTCKPSDFEVDTQKLNEKIYQPTAAKHHSLQQSTVLYLDHSTCVIDARRNSVVFRKLLGQLSLYTDTLCLIKKDVLEKIPNTDKTPTSTDVFNTINGIEDDIRYADIGKAVNEIGCSNAQSILITDFEYFDKNQRNQDGFPYLSGAFKNWLEKGHSIYIISEPYQEQLNGRTFDKKRFYVIFTDDLLNAPISNVIKTEIMDLVQNGVCTWFKLTNSDITVQSPKSDMVAKDLTYNVDYFDGFEYISIDDSWDAIREYVMKLDKYGEPLLGEKPEPLISNIMLNNGENYTVRDVQIIATNITSKYLALEDSTVSSNEINISDGFILDKDAFKSNKLNVMFTDKIFTDGYLADKFGGNLIRLDFVITKADLVDYDPEIFQWKSIWSPDTAICISKSIDNALHDVNVVPTCPSRKIIHTIFIKTESFE